MRQPEPPISYLRQCVYVMAGPPGIEPGFSALTGRRVHQACSGPTSSLSRCHRFARNFTSARSAFRHSVSTLGRPTETHADSTRACMRSRRKLMVVRALPAVASRRMCISASVWPQAARRTTPSTAPRGSNPHVLQRGRGICLHHHGCARLLQRPIGQRLPGGTSLRTCVAAGAGHAP